MSKKQEKKSKKQNMYNDAKTWNPFRGCHFNCSYCVPSFKAQAKRLMHRCKDCYTYTPHEHPTRLKVSDVKSSPIVFVCGNGDVNFCNPSYLKRVVEVVNLHNLKHGDRTYYLQSKRPECLNQVIPMLNPNTVLVTTLETNRDKGYDKYVSATAPKPSERFKQFLALHWHRKIVTVEPVLDFDVEEFSEMIIKIHPEQIWLGFNSKPKPKLPEPSADKMYAFADLILKAGIPVKGKTLKGIPMPKGVII